MTEKARQLLDQALGLSADERADLASRILLSLDADIVPQSDDDWEQLLKQRSAELDEAAVKAISWAEVRRELLG